MGDDDELDCPAGSWSQESDDANRKFGADIASEIINASTNRLRFIASALASQSCMDLTGPYCRSMLSVAGTLSGAANWRDMKDKED